LEGAVQYHASENARIFSKCVSDQKGKIPGEMGGVYRNEAYGVDATYSIKGDKVYVEKGKVPEILKPEFFKVAVVAAEKGLGKSVTGIVEVGSLDEVGITTRMDQRQGTWTDPMSGTETPIQFLLPPSVLPKDPGAKKVQGTFEITQSGYVYVPPAPIRTEGDLAVAEDLAGAAMKKQKTLFGVDVLPEKSAMPLAEGGPIQSSALESLRAMGVGKVFTGARDFGVAVTGARLTWGGLDYVMGGSGKSAGKVVSIEEYKKLGVDFGIMTVGGLGGEKLTALFIANVLKRGKSAFANHAGGIAVATTAMDLIHKGKIDWGTAIGAGMMLAAHGVKLGIQAWRKGSLAAAAADPEPVSKTALAVELVVFEGISYGFEKWHEGKIDGIEKDLRFKHAAALKKLDQAIEGLAQGTGDEKTFASAAKGARATFGAYASFLMIYRTKAGEDFQGAVTDKDKAEAKARLESDFSWRMKSYKETPSFVSLDTTKDEDSYAVNIAISPEGLAAQYQDNITKRVKILLERMKKDPAEMEKYLAMFQA